MGKDVPPEIVNLTSHARDVPDKMFRNLPRCEGEGDSTAKAIGPAKSRLEGPEIDPGSRFLFKNSQKGDVEETYSQKKISKVGNLTKFWEKQRSEASSKPSICVSNRRGAVPSDFVSNQSQTSS